MKRTIYTTIPFVFSACALLAQTPPAPAFEVASIKPAAPMERGKIMIGCKGDAGRVNCANISLKDLLGRAYSLKSYQITGPSWIDSERWDIVAKIPDGAGQDKVPEMWQSLLSERFHMTTHKESKELSIYALIVGKNGPKLKKSEDGDAPPIVGPDGAKISAPKGAMMINTLGKMQLNKATMSSFSDMLSRMMDRPVVDMTGVQGNYDITLEVAMEDLIGMKKMAEAAHGPAMAQMRGDGPAPDSNPHGSIYSAVQQLGLKLDARKAPVDFLVVDKAEKVATEN